MKRARFKKEFTSLNEALTKVPTELKEDSNIFEMTDGNKTYKVRWEGTLTEGKAVALNAKDDTKISEEMSRMKSLWGYKSEDTLGKLKGVDRINENEKFIELVSLKKKRVVETNQGGHASFHNGGEVGPSFENTLGRPLDIDGVKENEILDEGFAESLRNGALTLTAILGFINANAQSPEKLEKIKDTISQNAGAKMVQDIKAATGIEFTQDAANRIFKYEPQKDFKHEAMPDLYLGKYKDINVAKVTGKNRTDNNGGSKYVVDIADKRYVQRSTFQYIASQNKKLKGATIEFTLNGSPMPSKTIKL